jgi:signal transduction histidine kinase/ActR/RegA family two-component response regulator
MNTYGRDDASVTGVSGQPGATGHGKDHLYIVRGNDRRRREGSVIDDEAAVLDREKSASTREDAAHLREGKATSREDAAGLREDAAGVREDAAGVREGAAQVREGEAHLREGAATSREQEIRAAETKQAASDIHMMMLQQANARLVTATIEAQQLAEQVQAAKAELVNARMAAEEANLAKSDFLSSMSHELRSPLNAILGFAQLLETSNPPPTAVQNARLQQIIKAGWFLLELINEILDLAAIESGRLSLSREPVPLTDVLRECQSMIAPIAEKRDIRVNYLPFDHTCFVDADRTRLKQVLINLLTNAIKYNRKHGTVEVKCAASTPERIRVSFTDTGKGLCQEELARLFHPFDRLGQESGGEEGTGIGLVVTKQLVEMMGGAIGVESTVGVGSEFWVELVRVDTPQAATGYVKPTEVAPQFQEDAALRTLLYVEDNPANLMLIEHIVDGHPSLRILSAHDGSLGVELARHHVPDVILMDIGLPGMSGVQALNILRKDPATAHIPVIALSANAMPRDIELAREAGFFHYLTKPIKINEFMNALDDALKFAEKGKISGTGSINKNETP